MQSLRKLFRDILSILALSGCPSWYYAKMVAIVCDCRLTCRIREYETGVVLTKEKAFAMADTLAAPAAAERLRQAERRTARFVWVYPMLKHVPAPKRAELLREAQEYACKRWIIIFYAAVLLLAAASPFISRAVGGAIPSVTISMPFVQLGVAGLLFLQHFYSRQFLKIEVARQFPAGTATKLSFPA